MSASTRITHSFMKSCLMTDLGLIQYYLTKYLILLVKVSYITWRSILGYLAKYLRILEKVS